MTQSGICAAETEADGKRGELEATVRSALEAEEVNEEEKNPDASDFPGAQRKQTGPSRQEIQDRLESAMFDLPATEEEQPTATGEEESEAICATRDVIDGRAMDGMNNPEQRDKERS